MLLKLKVMKKTGSVPCILLNEQFAEQIDGAKIINNSVQAKLLMHESNEIFFQTNYPL